MKPKLLLGALVIPLLLVLTYTFLRTQPTQPISQSPEEPLVETQPNAPGTMVIIPRVVLDQPGYVMIHRAAGNQPGEIVMTGNLLPVGETTNVTVKTGTTTRSGETYFAMLHYDDGNGVYDTPALDQPVVHNGQIVMKQFAITGTPFKAHFLIRTNNTTRTFTAAMYHNQSDKAYLTANDPNTIQVDVPGTTWGEFFDSLPFKLTQDCLTTGTGQTFCTNDSYQLRFVLNSRETPQVLDQPIQANDNLEIIYGP